MPFSRHLPILLALATVAGCARAPAPPALLDPRSVDCMARAMYFESVRSSRDGMVAVGSVVMNRVASPDFPNGVCAVVGQRNQFAPGVMTREMRGEARLLAEDTARAVLRGERHAHVAKARFFHAATYRAGFDNIHYVLTAGGNAFYEKRHPSKVTRRRPPPPIEGMTSG